MSELSKLYDGIINLEEDTVEEILEIIISKNIAPLEIVEVARNAIIKIGDMFEKKEIFLTELIMAGELLKTIMNKIGFTPEKMKQKGIKFKGRVIMGTVQGDIHDIGRSIVNSLLISNGYDVIDLGNDVPAQKFIDAIKQYQPQVVGLSGLLTAAFNSMKNIVDTLTASGLRNSMKIMIGGGAVDSKVCEFVNADGFGSSAVDAVKLVETWIGGKK